METLMKNLVKSKEGLISRTILTDQAIYQQELEQIFGRCWLFVGHESQVAKPNDFTANYMGEDPVLVTRDSKGKLHTFLNMCRHRGNRICRADYGNAPSFMCTYHGWTFATDGKLVGVPGFKEAYFEELDRSQWGLVEARTEAYKGLIFATWDQEAPTLLDYLGDMAWYLDMAIDRRAGGIEFTGGVHRWVMHCNWKLPADNFIGDGYHVPITHRSIQSVRGSLRPNEFSAASRGRSYSANPGNGHGLNIQAESQFTQSQFQEGSSRGILKDYYEKHRDELKQRLGDVRSQFGMGRTGVNSNTFPNLATIHTAFRVWHPRGPDKTEVWSYFYVEKDAPQEIKNAMRTELLLTFGPSGNLEQDDMNNFGQSTTIAKSLAAKEVPMNLQLGLGHEPSDEALPGSLGTSPGEHNQRAFYARWAEVMDAPSWSQITIDPRTRP